MSRKKKRAETPAVEPPVTAASRDTDRWWFIGLLVAAVIAMIATVQPSPHLCNDASRLAFADALVNHGTFAIDGTYFESTCDRLKIDGKFHSDKPPVLSLVLAGLLWILQAVAGWRIPEDLAVLYPALALLVTGTAWVAAYVGLTRWLSLAGVEARNAAVAAALGLSTTLFFVFTTTLNNHSPAGALLVWCLFHTTALDQGEGHAARHLAWLGLLASLACVIDPLAVSLAIPLVAVAVWERRRSPASLVPLAVGLVPVGVHVAGNFMIGGHPLLLNVDPDAFFFKGSMHDASTITGAGWKHESLGELLRYGFHSLVGDRGLFVYSPLAAPGLVGLAIGLRGDRRAHFKRLWRAVFWGLAAFVLLTVGFSNNYSGWTYGVRWHCVVIPILVSGIALGDARLDGIRRTRWRLVCGACAAIGVVMVGIGIIQPWTTHKNSAPHSSAAAVLSDSPVLVRAERRAAARMNRVGRHLEALDLAGHALRRNPDDAEALWEGLQAAVVIEDRDAVGDLRLRARALDLPPGDRERFEQKAAQLLDD